MQRWTGSKSASTDVEIWFGNQGAGEIQVYDRPPGTDPVATNAKGSKTRLSFRLPPQASKRKFLIVTTVTSGTAVPLFIKLSQNGAILPADDAGAPANGTGPFTELPFGKDAKHGAQSTFLFDLRVK